MVSTTVWSRWALAAAVLIAGVWLAPAALAASEATAEADAAATSSSDIAAAVTTLGITLAAALVMVAASFATAKVQAAVGSGGTGALAEKPELFVSIVVLIAIPETILVLGFVMAFIMLNTVV